MRKIEGEQVSMRVFLGESDRAGHRPLSTALLELFKARGLAGATIVDLPLVIEVVDTQEHLDAVLPEVDRLMQGGLITMEKVHVLHYAPNGAAQRPPQRAS